MKDENTASLSTLSTLYNITYFPTMLDIFSMQGRFLTGNWLLTWATHSKESFFICTLEGFDLSEQISYFHVARQCLTVLSVHVKVEFLGFFHKTMI